VVKYKESRISAHHNYLVNDMLTPGFCVGDSGIPGGFYFVADLVLAGESTPRISARLMDEQGVFLLEVVWNRITENPGGCSREPIPGGFRILNTSSEALLEVRTQSFANGFLTRLKGRLCDEKKNLRMEPLGESVQIHGEANLVLAAPFAIPVR
jgi:hypothetical protein